MARKFKKRLAPKQTRRKSEPVLSVNLIRKESIDKAIKTWKNIVAKFKSFKLKLAK